MTVATDAALGMVTGTLGREQATAETHHRRVVLESIDQAGGPRRAEAMVMAKPVEHKGEAVSTARGIGTVPG